MSLKDKPIVVFGSLNNVQEDSRNNILVESLGKIGWTPVRCTANTGLAKLGKSPVVKLMNALACAPFRWIILLIRYLVAPSHNAVYVPYPPYLDVWIVCILSRLKKRLVVIDAFMGIYDTLVRDRALLKAGGLPAIGVWHYEKLMLHLVDIALVDTPEHVMMLRQDYSLPEDRVVAVPVGIDENLWKPVEYPVEGSGFRVLLWTTFIPLHGVDVVAKAAKIVEKLNKDIRFTVIGTGQLANQFKETLETLDIGNLEWIDRFLPLDEIQQYVVNSHCCLGVFGNQEKTGRVIPYKAYQTLASARPFVTADTTASRRLFSNMTNAVLVPVADPIELAGALSRLSRDRALSRRIAEEGHRLYKRQLSNQVVRKTLKEILDRVSRVEHG